MTTKTTKTWTKNNMNNKNSNNWTTTTKTTTTIYAITRRLSGPAIRTPRFHRFARIDLQKKTTFEALGQIRANRVFSPIRIQIRVIRVQSSLLSIFWKVDSQKKCFFFRNENRFAENIRDLHAKRESIRANWPTKLVMFLLPCFFPFSDSVCYFQCWWCRSCFLSSKQNHTSKQQEKHQNNNNNQNKKQQKTTMTT